MSTKLGYKQKVVLVLAGVLTLMTSVHVMLAGYFINRQDRAAAFADLDRELAAWRDDLQEQTVQLREAALAAAGDTVLLNRLAELMTLEIRLDEEAGPDEIAELARTHAYWKTISLSRLQLVLRTADFSSVSVYLDGRPSHQVSKVAAEMMIRSAAGQRTWVGASADARGELPLGVWPAWKPRAPPEELTSTTAHEPAVSFRFVADDGAVLEIAVPVQGVIERVVGDEESHSVTLYVSSLALAGGSAPASADRQPSPTTMAILVFRKGIDREALEDVARKTGKWPVLLSADGRHQQRPREVDPIPAELLSAARSAWTDPSRVAQGAISTTGGLAYAMLLPWRFEGEPRLILGLASSRDNAIRKVRQTVAAMLLTASLILVLTIAIGTLGVDRMIDAVERARGAALEEAERLARLRSEFLAQMSHELRTPLNAILGYAQILKRDALLSERQARGLVTIQESGQHLATLIDDILDLSRMSVAKLELYPQEVDLRAFLDGVADIIRVKAEEKSLRFGYEPAPDLPRTVSVDDKRLRQILLNLLGNAVKFTDRGAVTLRVGRTDGTHATTAVGQECAMPVRLRFEVADTGIGMSAGQLARIFQPFEQVSDIGHRRGGAGLGLAISRQLVQLMGGEIHVDSHPDSGSLFWFELELPASQTELAPPNREPEITEYEGPRRTVWIVDDVAQNRAMLLELLTALDFRTLDFGNGRELLERLELERPDLVLMDLMMPVMDGLEATRRIRRRTDLAGLPIVAVSASTSPEDETRSLEAGASAFVSKPVVRQKLLETLGGLLQLKWTFAPPAERQEEFEHAREDFVIPPPHEMEVLHRLACAGSMRDLRARARYLQELDPRYAPFAQRLDSLARRYQSRAIRAFVERHRRAG